MFILDDILLAPLKGAMWLGKRIHEHVNDQWYNIPTIMEALKALEESLQAGKISKEEHGEREELLLKRLEEAQTLAELKKQGGGR